MILAKPNHRRQVTYHFSKEYGFGIVFEIEEGTPLCFFEDGVVRKPVSEKFGYYSQTTDIVEQSERESERTRCAPGKIAAALGKAKIAFSADGRNELSTAEVTLDQKRYIAKMYHVYGRDPVCSCGVWDCIHKAVAVQALRDRIAVLQERYLMTGQPVRKDYLTSAKLYLLLENFDRSPDLFPSPGKEDSVFDKCHAIIEELLRPDSDAYIAAAIHSFLSRREYFYDAGMLQGYRYLFAAFAGNERIRTVLENTNIIEGTGYEDRQQKSNRLVLKRAVKEYDKAYSELYGKKKNAAEPSEMKEFILKYREDDPGLLTYYALSKPVLSEADVPYLERIAAESTSDRAKVSLVIEKIDAEFNGSTDWEPEVFAKLLSLFPAEESLEICRKLKNIKLSPEAVHGLGKENEKKLLNCIQITERFFRYALTELLSGASDEEKGKYILSKLSEIPPKEEKGCWALLTEEIPKLKNYRLLYLYAAFELGRREITDPLPAASIADVETYFAGDYMISETGEGVVIRYRIFSPGTGREVLLLEEVRGALHLLRHSFLGQNGYDLKEIKAFCVRGRENAYNYETEKAFEKQALREFDRAHADFTRAYKELCASLSTERIVFSGDKKAEIEYHFSFEDRNMLMFRVGNTKFYLVKSGGEFLRAFTEGSTLEYGKDLILTHNAENLNESDAVVIKYLMSARYTMPRANDSKMKRYIYLSDAVMPNLFELLAGRTVYFEEEPVTVRLEDRKYRVTVDENYALGTTLIPDTEKLYCFGSRAFVLRKENGQEFLDVVSLSEEETGLLVFAERQRGICIRPILGDFKRNLYSRFFDFIDVPGELQRMFRLGDIRINAYFDYEDGMITVHTKFQKNDSELAESQIADIQDMARVKTYREYLSALGFTGETLAGESEILSFFKMDFGALKKLCNVYLSESLSNKQILSVNRQIIRVQYEKSGVMKAFLEKSEYSEEELAQILRSIRKKKKFIILEGNRIIDLDTEEAKEFSEAVSDLGLDEKALYRKKEIAMVNAIKAFAHERNCRPDSYLRGMIEEIRHYKDAELPLPRLKEELKGYQQEGFRWLKILSGYHIGGILADDMGLGKTLQMIALIKSDPAARPSLVVCPKSLVFNWESEFGKFDGKTNVIKICGTAPQRADLIRGIDYQKKAVYVTSYDSLRNDIDLYSGEFQYGILDEAQYIKNVKALKTLSVKEIQARHRFAVTGTPIENSVIDLWSIFDFIMPGYFEELSAFKNAYAKDGSYADSIARKVGPFILKRSKADVLTELPPKFERIISAEMSSEQRKLYDAMRADAAEKMKQNGQVFEILPYITRLRQVCVDPAMFVEEYRSGSGKMDFLREMIPEYIAAGHRLLIFSQFVKGLNSVEEILKNAGIPYYLLTGATPAKERAAMTDDFNNGGEADVFLISLKAGGTGLNLTGADTVVHLDPWWNVSAENQATDRTHRIGQQRNVEVIKLIAENSIEQRVIELQQLKKDVADRMIAGDDSNVTGATLEDIAFILRQQ